MAQQAPKQVDKYIISNKLLGEGQFGKVYRGYQKDCLQKVVAVKQIPLNKASQDPKLIKLLRREIEILMQLKNDYIVQMYHATRTPNNLYMFLEYCGDGDLKGLIKQRGRLTESEAVLYFRQIVEGFRFLSQKSIIHRDIKPANILISEGKAKISDFGFAKCLDNTGMDEAVKQTFLGTPLYMSPQILMEKEFSGKCDVWSLGMMFYEMLYGKTPWTAKTPYQLYKNIKDIPLNFPETPVTSDLVKDMLRKMLMLEESERISWVELFKHPLISLDENDIQEELDRINQDKDMDNLLKSVNINDFYLKRNKIVGIDKTQTNKAFNKNKNEKIPEKSAKDEEDQQQQVQNQQDQEKKITDGVTQEVIDMGEVFQKQDELKRMKNSSIKIDSYLTFQRNIGIFVNLTTNQIFKSYKEKRISFPEQLFYRIIFVLQKHQLIGFQNLENLMKSPECQLGICNQNEWKFYQETKEFSDTLVLIKNDNGFIYPYFNEVSIRTENFLKGSQQDAKVKKFLQILNNDLSTNNKAFDEIYQETLKEILQALQNYFVNKNYEKRRETLQMIKYIFICKDLNKYFQWKQVDDQIFHLHYEKYDNMAENELEQDLAQDYSKL